MKSLLQLWKVLAYELASICCTSATRDFDTVALRSKHEGLSFLTITLPALGKDFEKSLDQGTAIPHLSGSFHLDGSLPRFLGGFFDRVFDRRSGALLDHPDIEAIRAIRQLTLMFGKIALPCTPERERNAMLEYVKCEQDVKHFDRTLSQSSLAEFASMSDMLFGSVFTRVDRDIYYGEAIPKHGPGKTADKLFGNEKYNLRTWTARLEEIFPVGEFLLPNWRYYDNLEQIDILEPEAEIPVKVVSVPKTLKTPRIIGIEPTAMQYAQQAVLPLILDSLNRSTAGRMLGFDDQVPNQELARQGSLFGDLATLDLSEASDRVSNELVRTMLRNHPHLFRAVDASRSRKAHVPGTGVIRLSKFASMGSALCFPFEAMVFLTIICLGIQRELNAPLDSQQLKKLIGSVRVYGDDIIVPVDYVQSVVTELTRYNAKVNVNKSFWTGRFRESCGKEYYGGDDVSIVRVRHMFPTRRTDAIGISSIVSLRNQLYWAGYWKTVEMLDERIRKLITYFPTVLPSSPVLGRHSALGFDQERFDAHLHRPLVRGYVRCDRIPSNPLDGEGALLKYFLKREDMPSFSGNHLERSGRPQSADIKLRWASAT